MEKKPKILILIKNFQIYPKHQPKIDMIKALEKYADVYYWHKDGHIQDILQELAVYPDFIFHYDIAWGYSLSPRIQGLKDIDIPKGCYVIDLHWSPNARIQYIEQNDIDLIFSATKQPFLTVFPQYKQKLRWFPWSINPEIMKDWGMNKDIDYLLMGLVYVNNDIRGNFPLPRKIPPKGRYAFRDAVFLNMKNEPGFVFHPHPGHRITKSDRLIVNDIYAKELNRSKIFFTCGSRNKTGGIAVLKFFEAPACKTLLLAEPNDDITDLGFIDGENYVACTTENVVEKAKYYLANERERMRITENGYRFIHSYHTNEQRAQQMINEIRSYLGKLGN